MNRKLQNIPAKAPNKPLGSGVLGVDLAKYVPVSHEEKPTDTFVEYGADNKYPQYLVDLYHASPTHNALCNTIASMIYGQGFDSDSLEARLLFAKWDLEDELRKATLDLKIQRGFYLEITWSLDRSVIANVRHLPFENVRCGVADEHETVNWYYYAKDWASREEPQALPRFNPETKNEHPVQILAVHPFTVGSFYYPKPDYIGAINYIELEKEISVYHINNIKNGLAPSFAIHFANGFPDEQERRNIRNDIERETAGPQNAGKFFMTFSDTPERRPVIEPFPLSDADKQYQFLSEETTAKIMIGHRVTNPQMFGVMVAGKLGGGSEIAESANLFNEQVVNPERKVVIEAVESMLGASGVKAKVYPRGQQVAEANVTQSYTGIQVSSALEIVAREQRGELTRAQAIQLLVTMLGFPIDAAEAMFQEGVALASEAVNLDEAFNYLAGCGEELGDEWELIDAREVDYDLEDLHDSAFQFARVLRGNPGAKSEQDSEILRVRYAYKPNTADEKSRDFCSRMVNALKVYRKEDILAAGSQAVNPGWGPRGADTYSIWLYKGGGSCRHFWERQTYLRKDNKLISVNEAQRIIRSLDPSERKAVAIPTNERKVAQRPRDMVNRGFLKPRNFNTPR